MFWIPMAIGAALAAAKSGADAEGRESDKRVQGATTRYSPWTGMKGAQPRQVDTFGNILKGGMTGAMIGSMGQNAGWWGDTAAPQGGSWSTMLAQNPNPNQYQLGVDMNIMPGTY